MSSNCPGNEQTTPDHKQAAMDAAVMGDSNLQAAGLQVSNLLRKLAASSGSGPQPSKLGLNPMSLRERLLAGDLTASSLAAAESRSSSDLSIPFDSELQSLWELSQQQQQQQQQQHQQQQQQQQQQMHHPQGGGHYESSPLNPNSLPAADGQALHQMHLRQQLGAMAAALLPRSSSLQPSTDSAGSTENRAGGAVKRRWADCLGETSSLPSSSPASPARRTPPPQGETQALLALEGSKDDPKLPLGGSGPSFRGSKEGTPAENSNEWEPRVRRKRAKGAPGSDDDVALSEEGGSGRIKAKSMTERQRRDRISDALRRLRSVVNSHGDMASMLNEAVDLIQQQKRRIEELEMQILQQRLRQQLAGGCRTLF